jgi:hypothetical protein
MPNPRRAVALRKQLDRVFLRRSGFLALGRQPKRLHTHKAEFLMVPDRPETPSHTNRSENDIRYCVPRRKLSARTRSNGGRDCRDAILGLAKTCGKFGIAVWDYLGSRLRWRAKLSFAAGPLRRSALPTRVTCCCAHSVAPVTNLCPRHPPVYQLITNCF